MSVCLTVIQLNECVVDVGVNEALGKLSEVQLEQTGHGADLNLMLESHLVSPVQPLLQTLHGAHAGAHAEQTLLLQP